MTKPLIVQIAETQIGVRETGGNNVGKEIALYQGATWLKPGAWPWCAAFTAWVLREALKDMAFRSSLGLAGQARSEIWRCLDASAFGWEKWARNKGLPVLDETHCAKAGDFVVFDFSHIGIVTQDQPTPATPIYTIEGNTNGKGERDSESGDGVWRKIRKPSLVKSYIRLIP